MLNAFLYTLLVSACYWGYCNYQSYPKEHHVRHMSKPPKDKDELKKFYSKWNPKGRDKPVFKGPKWRWGI